MRATDGRPGVDWKAIPLTNNKLAIVDAADYEWLMQWMWYAHLDKRSGKYYAVRNRRKDESGPRGIIRMHSVIAGTQTGEHTDHHDEDTLNNRRYNLRTCSVSQNGANRAATRRNALGYKGVRWVPQKGKYAARLIHYKKEHFLGYHLCAEEAAHAYDREAVLVFGEFAKLNFPQVSA